MIMSVRRHEFEKITQFLFEVTDIDWDEVPSLPPFERAICISEALLCLAQLAGQLEQLHATRTRGTDTLLLEAENPR